MFFCQIKISCSSKNNPKIVEIFNIHIIIAEAQIFKRTNPIYIDIKIRTLCCWARLIVGKQTKYSNIWYKLCCQLNENHNMQLSWILFVKQIFNECGFPNIWETELFDHVDSSPIWDLLHNIHLRFSLGMFCHRRYQYRCFSSRLLILVTSLLIYIYVVNSCCYFDFIVISLYHCYTLSLYISMCSKCDVTSGTITDR
jgi:hypothetical protein